MNAKMRTTIAALLAAGGLALYGCNKHQETAPSPTPSSAPTASPGSSSPSTDNGSPPGSGMSGAAGAGSGSSSAMNTTDTSAMGQSQGSMSGERTTGEMVDDTWITAKVKSALISEKNLKSSDIKVDTREGQITLSGTAPSTADIDHAEQVAKGVKGVKGVDNRIQIAQR